MSAHLSKTDILYYLGTVDSDILDVMPYKGPNYSVYTLEELSHLYDLVKEEIKTEAIRNYKRTKLNVRMKNRGLVTPTIRRLIVCGKRGSGKTLIANQLAPQNKFMNCDLRGWPTPIDSLSCTGYTRETQSLDILTLDEIVTANVLILTNPGDQMKALLSLVHKYFHSSTVSFTPNK